jgi:glycine betaine/proline transport system substrate-binding protein
MGRLAALRCAREPREAGERQTEDPGDRAGRVTTTKTGGSLLVAILAIALVALAPAGCGLLGQGEVLRLANIGWDENVAVSSLTKALLEDELAYELVEISTQDLDSAYRDVAKGELDAFQDVWLPNQEDLLEGVAGDVEHLDPWFLGQTRQSMAVPAYMDIESIGQLNGTDAEFIFGIEPSSRVMREVVGGDAGGVIPAYDLEQKLVQAPTAGMLAEVGRRYALREEFAFLAWSPHWMNQRFDIRYLEDPKDAMGPTNDPAEVSTIVSEDLREEDPAAYAFLDALELTEDQINGLERAINEAGSLAGARRWASENRGVVRPWIEAARSADEEQ